MMAHQSKAEPHNVSPSRISQNQLLLPLLDVLDAHPKGLSASAAVAALADHLSLDADQRFRRVPLPSGGTTGEFARDVRWARQRGKLAGLIDGRVHDLWRLPVRNDRDLRMAAPGVVVTVFETPAGAALWAEAEAALGYVEDRSLQTIVTSPPYPLESAKQYGGRTGAEYLDWMVGLCREFQRVLTDDGSLILNLGDVWTKGSPTLSLYQERMMVRLVDDLGFHLAQRLVWHNPSKPRAPAQWVTIERVRLVPSLESVLWFGKGANPKADNRRCLAPYSPSMKRLIAAGGERAARRPSGHQIADGGFARDNGGAIRTALVAASNTASNDPYHRHCREVGLPAHPAPMPRAIPELMIPLTTEPGDPVADFFAGSMVVPAVAEELGRPWIACDASLTYLRGAVSRFPTVSLL